MLTLSCLARGWFLCRATSTSSSPRCSASNSEGMNSHRPIEKSKDFSNTLFKESSANCDDCTSNRRRGALSANSRAKAATSAFERSEERRVGKEGRYRWARGHEHDDSNKWRQRGAE